MSAPHQTPTPSEPVTLSGANTILSGGVESRRHAPKHATLSCADETRIKCESTGFVSALKDVSSDEGLTAGDVLKVNISGGSVPPTQNSLIEKPRKEIADCGRGEDGTVGRSSCFQESDCTTKPEIITRSLAQENNSSVKRFQPYAHTVSDQTRLTALREWNQ